MVDDVDAHHGHAAARGAEVVYEPVDQPYGYREYSARDLEGGLWGVVHERAELKGIVMSEYVPPGTNVVTPYLCVRRCSEAIDWYVDVFGAVEDGPRYTDPDGRGAGHASIRIGGAEIMLSDAYPDYGAVAPEGGPRHGDVRGTAVRPRRGTRPSPPRNGPGAVVQRPVAAAFHGSRMGTLMDPFGVRWMVGTYLQDVGSTSWPPQPTGSPTGTDPGPL